MINICVPLRGNAEELYRKAEYVEYLSSMATTTIVVSRAIVCAFTTPMMTVTMGSTVARAIILAALAGCGLIRGNGNAGRLQGSPKDSIFLMILK